MFDLHSSFQSKITLNTGQYLVIVRSTFRAHINDISFKLKILV